jgi:pyrroline-5-carboxylate reductase
MPNLALTCGAGVIGCMESSLSPENRHAIETLLKGTGLVVWLPEQKLDALAAFAGSGPAFIFVLIEAMIDSGVFLGFSAMEAKEFALQTLQGAIELLRHTGKTPSELKWQIAVPKGTTIAGLKALEQEGLRHAIFSAFIATYNRAKEIH